MWLRRKICDSTRFSIDIIFICQKYYQCINSVIVVRIWKGFTSFLSSINFNISSNLQKYSSLSVKIINKFPQYKEHLLSPSLSTLPLRYSRQQFSHLISVYLLTNSHDPHMIHTSTTLLHCWHLWPSDLFEMSKMPLILSMCLKGRPL